LAETPDKRKCAFRGDIEVWASIGNVKQTGLQWAWPDHDTEMGANCGR